MAGGRGRRLVTAGAVLSVWLVLTLVVVALSLAAEQPPEYLASFGPDGTTSSGFSEAGPIAVDQQDHIVYVLDRGDGSLLKFDLEGHPVDFGGSAGYISENKITGLTFFLGAGESQVAVDSTSHTIYVTSEDSVRAFEANGEASEFTAGPGVGTSGITGFTRLTGVAVDVNGDIYASDRTAEVVQIFAPSGEEITQFSNPEPANLAVDTNGAVYVNRRGGTVTKLTPSEFPVTASTSYAAASEPLDPNSSYTVAVNPATNDVYVAQTNANRKIAWYDESGTLLTTFAGPGEEGEVEFAEGVGIDGASGKIFVANTPLSGLSQVEIFKPKVIYEGKPRVESIFAIDVTADSATLRARINPGTFETTYRFEYGLQDCALGPCTSLPLGGASIGDGHEVISVSQKLTGLMAGTIYHYRIFAENEEGDNLALEADHIFTTQPSGLGFQLSDSRAWELVSPTDKHGALLLGALNSHVQASADGESISYATRGSIEPDPEGNRTAEASTVLAHRAVGGWVSKDITLPNDNVTAIPVGSQSEYKLFSRDFAKAFVEPRTAMPHSPEATERTPYLRENTEPPAFTPLLTAGNVPPGTEFGGDPKSALGPVNIAAATPDLTHVVLTSQVPLVEGAPPAPADGIYRWAAGHLQPVSVLPDSEGGGMAITNIVGSASRAISGGHTVEHAISEDGSRIFWSAAGLSALYLRDMEAEETVRLDVEQLGATGAGKPEPFFQGASADGTVVFFTDSQQLTEDASPNGRDLYRCEIPTGSIGSGCSSLEDITSPDQSSGESSEVEGLTAGVGDDGSTIYFVARGVLDETANENGETADPGQPNLYIWRASQGVRYVATLSEQDQHDWGGEVALAAQRSAVASPNGSYLSFASERPLAGSDNLDAESGEPVQQVFRYDANADRLDCLSCKATNAAPEGQLAGELKFVDPRGLWQGDRVSAVLPEPTIVDVITLISLYSPRAVLDNGRVFFNSVDSLVPADVNGEWDVYQYEPVGVGDCSQSSGDVTTAMTAGGCVSLTSSGTGKQEAAFLDASETGDDAFFLTPEKLNAADEDSEFDVYDARVGGASSVPPLVSECSGEACQPQSPMPNDSIPSSSVFAGHANLKQGNRHCRKGQRRVRRHGKVVCVRRHHHGQKRHHKQAKRNRRAEG